MKLTSMQLRRIIKEEVTRARRCALRESTRGHGNLESDLLALDEYETIEDVHVATDRTPLLGKFTKRPATMLEVEAYDIDPNDSDDYFMYAFEVGGNELVAGLYPAEITQFFSENRWDFSY